MITPGRALLLEEPIPVNYYLVGTREWLETGVTPDAAPADHRICIERDSQLDEIRDWLLARGKLVFDCETTGSDAYPKDGLDALSKTSRLLTLQVGTEERVYVFQPKLLVGKRIKEIMESELVLHIAHNATFDFKMLLKKYSIHVVRMFCTMLAEQLLTAGKEGERPSLLELSRKYPPHRLISKDIRKQFNEHTGPLTRKQLYYAARDIVLPFPIARAQIQKIKDLKLELVTKDEMECIPCTAEMEWGGFVLNQSVIHRALPFYREEAARIQEEILELWNEELTKQGKLQNTVLDLGPEVFDLGSAQKKKQALHRIGIMVPNVSKGVLEEFDHPLCELLIQYEKQKKILSTYGENLFTKIHRDDGKFHPTFDQLGAGEDSDSDGRDKTVTIATGRYSSDAQQMPKAKKVYAVVTDPAMLAIGQQLLNEYKARKAA